LAPSTREDRVLMMAAVTAETEDKMTTKMDVLEALDGTTATTATTAQLQEKLGKSETTVRRALKDLEIDGKVVKGADGWTLSSPESTEDVPEVETDPALVKALEESLKKAKAKRAPKPDLNEARQRDAKVLEVLKIGELSKTAIAEGIGETVSLTYVSIWRLQKAGLIVAVRDGSRTPKYRVA
jgi:predicted Rossmann fold nucleotide-binding protein DprA/Smf involved in DNA uptake